MKIDFKSDLFDEQKSEVYMIKRKLSQLGLRRNETKYLLP